MNRINNLPPGILENILCFLPIQEAVRTCILSQEWRYLWIKIPKLVFIQGAMQLSTKLSVLEQACATPLEWSRMRKSVSTFKRRKLLRAINQVLSMHEGPIHEFTLSMDINAHNCGGIDHILSHLAQRNTVKKLKLAFNCASYRLPLSVFSFCQLTDLCLEGCNVSPPPAIDGFGSLTRLSLQNVYIYDESLRYLLSNCRFLKSVTLRFNGYHVHDCGKKDSCIINLFECLQVVETLSISFSIIQLFESSVHGIIPRELPTALVHLKYLTINGVSFNHKDGLSILVLLIKSSPNLEKLEIDNRNFGVDYADMVTEHDICSFTLKDYADVWLEHLNELHIGSFINQGNELNFVKLILAKSPVLKKVTIYLEHPDVDCDEELQICKVLLSSPRASPVECIVV